MLGKKEKDILASIGQFVIKSEPDDMWESALLKLMVIGDTVDFNLNFSYPGGKEKNVKLNDAFMCSIEVLNLHKSTHADPDYAKWNRSEFTLFASGKYSIKYIWDEELRNGIDKYNKPS